MACKESTEKVVIDGKVYGCVECAGNKYHLICSVSEAREILEIYESLSKIMFYYKQAVNRPVFIVRILELIVKDDVVMIWLEIA